MSENRKGINNPFYGKNHSAETIETLKKIASTRENPLPFATPKGYRTSAGLVLC
jgi:hypothetical protein